MKRYSYINLPKHTSRPIPTSQPKPTSQPSPTSQPKPNSQGQDRAAVAHLTLALGSTGRVHESVRATVDLRYSYGSLTSYTGRKARRLDCANERQVRRNLLQIMQLLCWPMSSVIYTLVSAYDTWRGRVTSKYGDTRVVARGRYRT
ncbi:hypothetical protein J6590_003461 [Homalodisca vitripennis]|nr:hypothetical protein J6590_003461 [Homalodisca vitripennis]